MMIEARGLVRTFKTKRGPVQAVQGVDLDVADGEIVGFLGPNGAGKTTTLRMLATLITPTSGHRDGGRLRPGQGSGRRPPRHRVRAAERVDAARGGRR